VWQGVYRLQDKLGGDSSIGRKLYGIFVRAGLTGVQARGCPWTCTAAQKDRLQWYVDGAGEIIRQTREPLLEHELVSEESLRQAEQEYERLLTDPHAFVLEVICCASGTKE
jgi:hypothetical protein